MGQRTFGGGLTLCLLIGACARAPSFGLLDADLDEARALEDGGLEAGARPPDVTPAEPSGEDMMPSQTSPSSADAGAKVDAASPMDAATPTEPRCRAGTYIGKFSGTISALLLINIPIEGELTIEASSSSTTDDLVIENGKIDGQDDDGNPVTAAVTGTLNCSTYQLVGGALRNGVYTRRSINQTVKFEGSVEATYQPLDPPTVTGTWHTKGGVESGSGPFAATLRK